MTPQEKKINDIAEALIEKFIPYAHTIAGLEKILRDALEYEYAIKCAIECQREVVKVLQRMDEYCGSDTPCKFELTESQQVLENLEKRLL